MERIGAKIADTVRIDTTHFVTTEGRGLGWEKAVEMNIPVVRPEWVEGCERGGRIVGVRQYYLDADPRQRMVTMGSGSAGQQQAPVDPRKPSVSSNKSKEEAPLPALPTDQASPTVNGQAVEKTEEEAHKKSEDDEKKGDEKEKNDEGDGTEEKTDSPQEQKVRIEDRDQQKIAIRPKSPEAKDKTVLDVPKSPVADVAEEGATTPGATSFQDIAL